MNSTKEITIFIMMITAAVMGMGSPQAIHAHCQIPCGIYDDHARVEAMLEDGFAVVTLPAR